AAAPTAGVAGTAIAGLPLSIEELLHLADRVFAFALAWSVGGSVGDDCRDAMDMFCREMLESGGILLRVPGSGAVFDYFVDLPTRQFRPWTSLMPEFKYNPSDSYFQMVVPTVDTTRFGFLISALVAQGKPVFVTGVTGTGKTVMVQSLLAALEPTEGGVVATAINFSAQTSSLATQRTVESKLEKKRKNLLGAPAGRKVVLFVDDVNMPVVEEYGAQPPVELLRQFLDFKGFYDREKLFWKDV
ncbi:unnamed protein product, partial [Phaeothamnion confervicola]